MGIKKIIPISDIELKNIELAEKDIIIAKKDVVIAEKIIELNDITNELTVAKKKKVIPSLNIIRSRFI